MMLSRRTRNRLWRAYYLAHGAVIWAIRAAFAVFVFIAAAVVAGWW